MSGRLEPGDAGKVRDARERERADAREQIAYQDKRDMQEAKRLRELSRN